MNPDRTLPSDAATQVAENWRSPLNAIIGLASYLGSDAVRRLPLRSRQQHAETIEAAGRRLLAEVDRLLDGWVPPASESGSASAASAAAGQPVPLDELLLQLAAEDHRAGSLQPLGLSIEAPPPVALGHPGSLRSLLALVLAAARQAGAGSARTPLRLELRARHLPATEADALPRVAVDVCRLGGRGGKPDLLALREPAARLGARLVLGGRNRIITLELPAIPASAPTPASATDKVGRLLD